jgi:hypothetical protein
LAVLACGRGRPDVRSLFGVTREATRPPDDAGATAPVNYRQLGESIEEAIVSGSVALDTIGAVLISADGQTVLTHYRNGRNRR